MTWCVCIDLEKKKGKVYDIDVKKSCTIFLHLMTHVQNPLAKNQLHNFFYNPLQVAKDDQGQDSNDVGIGGSSNNL
jgi:hypothetical protein